jgi:ubiquinone/menaquinone biosynthesis C-methylase UbiE
MANNQIIRQITDYSEIFPLIWKTLDVRAGQKALDIGVGIKALSAKQMIEQKLKVVGIDIDPDCQVHGDELGFPVHICDACSLPFEDDSYDFSLAFFSLHEIDPKKHLDVLSEMKRVSKKVVIIEPLPNTDEVGKIYDNIWQEAMGSVGKFEIYQPMDYWVSLMSRLGHAKISQFQLKLTKKVTKANAENFCEQSIEHFKRLGVNNRYTLKIKDLAEKIKTYGMEHSDVILIVGSFK